MSDQYPADQPQTGSSPVPPPAPPIEGQYPAAPGYQNAPQISGGFAAPGADVAPPKSILNAVKLMYVGAAMSLLGIVLAFVQKGETRDLLRERLEKDGKSLDDLDSMVNAGMAVAVVSGLIAVALWIVMAKTNEAGKSWARIVATVLGALAILSFLGSFAQGTATPLGVVVSLISLVLAVAILILLWHKDSSAYYAAKSAPRR